MADLKINPEEIQGALANFVKSYDPGVAARDEVGTVSQAGDGIARVEGLPSTMANELLQFENGTLVELLNRIRESFDKPITIMSGRRCKAHNTKWG